MPHKGHLIAVLAADKGSIIDIRTKKHLRTVPKWGGSLTKDGKYGLYAPSRYSFITILIIICIYEIVSSNILNLSVALRAYSFFYTYLYLQRGSRINRA